MQTNTSRIAIVAASLLAICVVGCSQGPGVTKSPSGAAPPTEAASRAASSAHPPAAAQILGHSSPTILIDGSSVMPELSFNAVLAVCDMSQKTIDWRGSTDNGESWAFDVGMTSTLPGDLVSVTIPPDLPGSFTYSNEPGSPVTVTGPDDNWYSIAATVRDKQHAEHQFEARLECANYSKR